MATIEELELRTAEIAGAEAAAVTKLIDCMRDLAVELPDGSQLAMRLATYARAMESYVERLGSARYATNEIHAMLRDLDRDLPKEEEE